ncbi:hypothetical protein ABL849_09970 [Variovorax sp. 375MFSha3.1]|uniref:hypothetical protein n=1 Tax=unclassified Variovorax TaxID=663243 RepID=UPI003AB0DEB8
MAFNPDPFKQAELEVANKSMGSQIAHSRIFHSTRSAFSSGGSRASKGIGALVGVGKLFLTLIPVPVVGSVVGAVVDAVNGKVRGALHEGHLGATASNAEVAKFGIKELTVENLDRYRWKVAHAFEELNQGIEAYNNSGQTCDDMYQFALLYEQVQRRKKRLNQELGKFKRVMDAVDGWIADLERNQETLLTQATNKIMEKTRKEIAEMGLLIPGNPAHDTKILEHKTKHVGCKLWCYCKKEAKYDPSTNWEALKTYAGTVTTFLQPIAISSIAVTKSAYTSDSDNSKFN